MSHQLLLDEVASWFFSGVSENLTFELSESFWLPCLHCLQLDLPFLVIL